MSPGSALVADRLPARLTGQPGKTVSQCCFMTSFFNAALRKKRSIYLAPSGVNCGTRDL